MTILVQGFLENVKIDFQISLSYGDIQTDDDSV